MINQVGVPDRVAKILTFPERVNTANINVRKLFKNILKDLWYISFYLTRYITKEWSYKGLSINHVTQIMFFIAIFYCDIRTKFEPRSKAKRAEQSLMTRK